MYLTNAKKIKEHDDGSLELLHILDPAENMKRTYQLCCAMDHFRERGYMPRGWKFDKKRPGLGWRHEDWA